MPTIPKWFFEKKASSVWKLTKLPKLTVLVTASYVKVLQKMIAEDCTCNGVASASLRFTKNDCRGVVLVTASQVQVWDFTKNDCNGVTNANLRFSEPELDTSVCLCFRAFCSRGRVWPTAEPASPGAAAQLAPDGHLKICLNAYHKKYQKIFLYIDFIDF